MSCMGDGPSAEIPVGAAILEAEAWADFAVVMAVMIESTFCHCELMTFINTVCNSGPPCMKWRIHILMWSI